MDWVIGLITGLGIISGILTLKKRDKKMGIIQLILTIIVLILSILGRIITNRFSRNKIQ